MKRVTLVTLMVMMTLVMLVLPATAAKPTSQVTEVGMYPLQYNQGKIPICLVRVDSVVARDDRAVLKALKRAGYRPARSEMLDAFMMQHHDQVVGRNVVALGNRLWQEYGYRAYWMSYAVPDSLGRVRLLGQTYDISGQFIMAKDRPLWTIGAIRDLPNLCFLVYPYEF